MKGKEKRRIVSFGAIAGLAAVVGGIAAATALWLRRPRRARPHGLAHRADGTDDSASLYAHVADEGTIPDINMGVPAASEPMTAEGDAGAAYDLAVPHFPEELAIPGRP